MNTKIIHVTNKGGTHMITSLTAKVQKEAKTEKCFCGYLRISIEFNGDKEAWRQLIPHTEEMIREALSKINPPNE